MKPHQYNRENSIRYGINNNISMLFLARNKISNNMLKQSSSRQHEYQNTLPYNIKLSCDMPAQFKQQQTHTLEPQRSILQTINLPIGEEVISGRQSLLVRKNKIAKCIFPSPSKCFPLGIKLTSELNRSSQSRSLPTGEYLQKNTYIYQPGCVYDKRYLKGGRKTQECKDLRVRTRKACTQSSIYQQSFQRQSLPVKTYQDNILLIHSLTRKRQANSILNEGTQNAFKLPNFSKSVQTPVAPLRSKDIGFHKQIIPLHQQKMVNFLKKYQQFVHSKSERPSRKPVQDTAFKEQMSIRSKHIRLSQKQRKRDKEQKKVKVQTALRNLIKRK